jgi:Putative metal-binding motif
MRLGAIGGLVLVLAMSGATTADAAPINDNYASRLPLLLGNADTRSNFEATIEPNEHLTTNDPSDFKCDKEGNVGAVGVQMDASLWWEFTGNGGRVTVSSLGSNFDTVIGVYEISSGGLVGCDDDIRAFDETRRNLGYELSSEAVVNTTKGRKYAVQVGNCIPAELCDKHPGDPAERSVTLRIAPAPANDDRVAATPLSAGKPLLSTNLGATEEPGEVTACGDSPYAKTVWFRYMAPTAGSAVFFASGFDTVLTVYRGDSALPVDCNDDGFKGQSGSSQLPAGAPPGPPLELQQGEYLIQVGGYRPPGFSSVAATQGQIEVGVNFEEDTDLDNDGVSRGQDCVDTNPAIRPGLPEVPGNDVDENCDGIKAFDRDGDRYLASPAGEDCDDANPLVHPGATEIRGNKVDENCDGVIAPAPRLTPTIGIVAYAYAAETQVRALTVAPAPKGARIVVACDGPGCPTEDRDHYVGHANPKLTIAKNLRLGVGAQVRVLVTKPGWIGRGRSFRIRSKAEPLARYFCLTAGGKRELCQ